MAGCRAGHHVVPGPAAPASGSGGRVAAVIREVAVEAPVAAGGHRLHQQVTADEGALPGGAAATEGFVPVAPRARLVDADLERLQIDRQLFCLLGVVAGEA